jgi:hypothetical protein
MQSAVGHAAQCPTSRGSLPTSVSRGSLVAVVWIRVVVFVVYANGVVHVVCVVAVLRIDPSTGARTIGWLAIGYCIRSGRAGADFEVSKE